MHYIDFLKRIFAPYTNNTCINHINFCIYHKMYIVGNFWQLIYPQIDSIS